MQEVLLRKIEQQYAQCIDDFARLYFLLMLSPQLFDSANAKLLLKLEGLMHSLQDQTRSLLVRWMRDIDAARLTKIVGCVQHALSQQLGKNQPNPQFGSKMTPLNSQGQVVLLHCRLLELLFRTNQLSERISYELFKNKRVMETFDAASQLKAHFKGAKLLNFLRYPFLLDLNYLSKLLQMETRIEHKLSMKKGVSQLLGPNQPLTDDILEAADNNQLFNAMFLHIEVRRNHLFEDAVQKLTAITGGFKNPLKVTFSKEPANDGGGVKKEFFQLLTSQIFHLNCDMFVGKADNRFYWFNGQSTEPPVTFGFVGLLVGLSIYNGVMLDLKFPRIIYKKLLAPEGHVFDSVEDLKQHEPDYYKSFKYILSTQDPLEDLEMTFCAEVKSFGKKYVYDLKPNGRKIKLTQANKKEYVSLFTAWLLNHSIDRQFRIFRQQFYRVVTGRIVKMFQAEELERIICGEQVINFKDLEKAVKYEGYTLKSPVVKWFWEILHGLSPADKKAFLVFVTGTDRVPIGGLANLKLTVERKGPDAESLPTSHTCSNVLLLPEYSTKLKLKNKLELALKYREGFGLI